MGDPYASLRMTWGHEWVTPIKTGPLGVKGRAFPFVGVR